MIEVTLVVSALACVIYLLKFHFGPKAQIVVVTSAPVTKPKDILVPKPRLNIVENGEST